MGKRGTEESEMVGLKAICLEVRWVSANGFFWRVLWVFVCLFVLFSLLIDIRDVDFYKEQYKKLYTIILFSYPEQTVTNS